MKVLNISLFFGLLFFISPIFARQFSSDASYEICFTREQNCTKLIVDEIAKARNQILIQMYVFTSAPIAQALVAAKKRGVSVHILLDKSQIDPQKGKYSSAKFFMNQGIPVQIDWVKGIAHSKIMIIDGVTTIGGSFNYTKNAENNNVENVTIIKDVGFAKIFTQEWHKRNKISLPVTKSKNG